MCKTLIIGYLLTALCFISYSENIDMWGKNLLKNSDFNDDKTNWSEPVWIKNNTGFTIVKNGDAKALKLSITSAKERAMVSQTICLMSPASDFRVMFDAKYNLPKSFFYVKVEFRDDRNKPLNSIVLLTICGTDPINKNFVKAFSLPTKTKYINLYMDLVPQKDLNENADIEISPIFLQPRAVPTPAGE